MFSISIMDPAEHLPPGSPYCAIKAEELPEQTS